MSSDDANAFIEHLHKNRHLRETLKDAILAEIVAAGRLANFHFDADDLKQVLPDGNPPAPSKRVGAGWDTVPD